MNTLSKAVLGLLGAVALFALIGWLAGTLMSAFDFPAFLAVMTALGGWFLLCCVVSLIFRHHWHEVWKRETMAPVPGVYMPRTQAQRDAVEWLAERSDGGAYVHNNPDETIELLAVKRGALHRFVVSRSGESTLVEWRPADWRYRYAQGLTWAGVLAFVVGIAAGGLVQEKVLSFPLGDDARVMTLAAVLVLTGTASAFAGAILEPDPEKDTGPGEWAHIGYHED
ncbi:MAG TPA: hypothetical protein VG479_11590 [Gaiellaceae bacterium]|jgi:hypothetical protein|nr:hypothetical protein [Gaiellaceae bacterium]